MADSAGDKASQPEDNGNTQESVLPSQPSQAEPSTHIDDATIKQTLQELLKHDMDMDTMTEKKLRLELEKQLQCNLSDRKALIRSEVKAWLEAQPPPPEEPEEPEEPEKPAKKRKASGFSKPASLSPAMQAFLGEESMSRPQVVQQIWVYIKANNLQNPANRRKIICDEKMLTIFKPPIDMFSMNKQLSKHIKSEGSTGRAKKGSDDEEESEDEDDNDEDSDVDEDAPPRKKAKAPVARKPLKKKANSTDEPAEKRKGGFNTEVAISKELQDFLGHPGPISRPEVTKRFWAYFKENNLQDPANRKFINSDEPLKALLGVANFQAFSVTKYLKTHFIKK
mmetsp:Transcript_9371/g.16587  ORF Transcript_9371/g.16587 Transcript_9371/m.16587 type:complete len:338 (-) Transcript_9371:811-1824(-)|eukprot:CAMPEP_0119109312 /NCGR_PEP_ID=MMETSP1180-20130426/17837_1 /TAXON_ID=3052 ORGANISM="Chlamydomonas cf sp, Strain CCMP681" /NCGR_SAMPLE_ID=MMETSP1180 /ASSEMBLY_ACC=CAM_ASM_000741 /LENGTH=337 /DNA_ID=CAMNT_0007095053 /DNA_START=27 /DNA_END=1040 /DNA_ORIENTATION=+